jgi:hypothetical protein
VSITKEVKGIRAKLLLEIGVEETVRKMRSSLEKDGFIFAENDKSCDVRHTNEGIKEVQNWSLFWSRKQLSDPYKPTFSIVIQGEVKKEGESSVVEAELIEYHHNREHFYGGTVAVEEYFDKLVRALFS